MGLAVHTALPAGSGYTTLEFKISFIKGMGANRDKTKLAMSHDERVADLQERQRLLTGALVSVRKPTIAALPGPAVGAGLALAMACDMRIAAQSAFLSTGYLKVGLSGDYGIAWLLTRLVGTSRARELMFTCDRVDAARCEAIGLVNRVVPDDRLHAEAFALAKSIAEGPTIAPPIRPAATPAATPRCALAGVAVSEPAIVAIATKAANVFFMSWALLE